MQKTTIGWTDRSANPIRARHKVTGKLGWHCVMHSPGCANCYSGAINHRFGTVLPYQARSGDQVEIFFDPRSMDAILRMRQKGQKFFLCDMTDMFADFVPDEYIDQIFAYIASCGQQTFQVLTKRPERMANWFSRVSELGHAHANLYQSGLIDYYSRHGVDLTRPYQTPGRPTPELRFLYDSAIGIDPSAKTEDRKTTGELASHQCQWRLWPLNNAWIGVSVEDRKRMERIDVLRGIPAAVRYLSLEPLIEDLGELNLAGIDWVIIGGESGPNRRPCEIDWIRSIAEHCHSANVPVFVKQDAGPKPGMRGRIPDDLWALKDFPASPVLATT